MTRIEDLVNVEVEHLVGLVTKRPLVRLRCESSGTVIVGQMQVDQAREIALHLLEAAARAEYECDFLTEAERTGFDDDVTGGILSMIRQGETRRHEVGDET